MEYISSNGAVKTTVSKKKDGFLLETKWIVEGISFNNSFVEATTLRQNGVQPTVDTIKDLNQQLAEKSLDRKNPKVVKLFDGISDVMKQIFS